MSLFLYFLFVRVFNWAVNVLSVIFVFRIHAFGSVGPIFRVVELENILVGVDRGNFE